MSYLEFLQYSFFGNTIKQYFIAIGIFLISVLAAIITKYIIINAMQKLAKKTKTKLDDTIVKIINKVLIFVIILAGVYFGIKSLNISQNIWGLIEKTIQVIFIFKIFQGLTVLIDFLIENYLPRIIKVQKGFEIQLNRLIIRIINIAIWIIGISMMLQLFGYNITAIVTGLGIGGLAIALAAQDTLGNFFSSISIMADKPYKIGDIIKYGDNMGTIKDIGLRTTRIETFFGTTIAVPNSELAKAAVENLSKRHSIRYDGMIGLTYDTKPEKIKKAVKIIKEILKEEKNVTKEYRVNFTEYDPSSLRLEFTYFVKHPEDYSGYLKTRHRINLAIKEAFEKEGIEMAFPTQTVYVRK
jgi:MscS family membrane protein